MKRILACLLIFQVAFAQTIAEKKSSFSRSESEMDGATLEHMRRVNDLLEEKRAQIALCYKKAHELYLQDAEEAQMKDLMQRVAVLKAEVAKSEEMWREESTSMSGKDPYALWHQSETTLLQLVMDYAASDYLYLIPPEIGQMQMSLNSNLLIPKEAWSECLELILAEHGVGVATLSTYLRELYFLGEEERMIEKITADRDELGFLPPHTRVCFIFTPPSTDARTDLRFFEKFANYDQTKIESLAGKIFITSHAATVLELLKIYEFAHVCDCGHEFQIVMLSKIDAHQMKSLLELAFKTEAALEVMPLEAIGGSLFLSGSRTCVKKAVAMIADIEKQIQDPGERTVFWYNTRHSDPEELAKVLARVYDLLVGEQLPELHREKVETKEDQKEPQLIVPNTLIRPAEKKVARTVSEDVNNFIVDPKTGAIIMVVEKELLPKIKELVKKLDVPKKMVQLEVLLFEKKATCHSKMGLNLLRLGAPASHKDSRGVTWNKEGGGILEFLISRAKGSGIPAYDLAYKFLLGQDNVQINASPSITTMNQTPATIAIVEEISINSGADEKKNKIYNRAQYGITIQITPTINMDGEGEEAFVTLDTDITFDTTKNSKDERPDVTRRHIKNHVRIGDGQTVILGGLHRKNRSDSKDSIPFLGEIPGIGKLFSLNERSDSTTEMFVFITPKILADPIDDAELVKRETLKKRPGDVPELIFELTAAKQREKKRLFDKSLSALFGEEMEMCTPISEYDGRS